MTDFDNVKFSNNSFDFQVLSELCEREGGAVAYRKEIHSLRKQSVTLQATAAEARFYLAVHGEVVPKGKAYCQYTLSGQPTEVAIIWSGETLINAVLRDINNPDTPHYDLQGRRIYKIDGQGKKIHVVKGKKVVIK